MTDLNAYVQSFLKEYTPGDRPNQAGDSLALEGCIGLYGATGDGRYREAVLRRLAERAWKDTDGMALLFALDETGEKRYEEAVRALTKQVRERLQAGKAMAPEELRALMPLVMACEMRFDRMAHVSDVVAQFRLARVLLFDEEAGLYLSGSDNTLRSEGMLLAALIDCIALCSQELYEHWRALVDLFGEAVRGLMPYQDKSTGLFQTHAEQAGEDAAVDMQGSALAAYALFKGARLGVLNPEWYLPLGRKTLAGLAEHPPRADGTDAGALMMAWAEYLRTARKSSEVKHDGTV